MKSEINCSLLGMFRTRAAGTSNSPSQRRAFAARLTLIASVTSSFVACGSSTAPNKNIPVNGGASAMATDGGIEACDHYFEVQYLRCGGPVLPMAETARIRGRFHQVCANEMALPGSGISAASLDACA